MDSLPLLVAVRAGKTEAVRALISQGVDINEQSSKLTPVHLAIQSRNPEILKLLLDAGADVDVKEDDDDGYTPLHLAIYSGDVEIVQMLLNSGANVNLKNNQGFGALYWSLFTSLMRTSDRKVTVPEADARILELLLQSPDVDVNEKRADGKTPVHIAAYIGNEDILRLLIDAGANCNEKRADGGTPLHKAATCGNTRITELLIEAGADVDARNDSDLTPLQLALNCRNLDVARVLVLAGADVDGRSSKNGRTVLHLATVKNDVTFVEDLLNRGADVGAKDFEEMTPLHCAAIHNRDRVIKVLMKNGADATARDVKGNTPVCYLKMDCENNAKSIELVTKIIEDSKEDNKDERKSSHGEVEKGRWDKLEQKIEELKECINSKINGSSYSTAAMHALLLAVAFAFIILFHYIFTL